MIRAFFSQWVLGAVVAAVCVYLVVPTLVVVPVSFTDTDFITFPPQGISWRWYLTFLGEGPWRTSTFTSIIVASLSALLSVALGTLAALGLQRLTPSLARIIVWLLLLPMIVPSIIIAVALYGVFARLGIIGTRLGLILADTLLALPFVVINVSAVMQKLDWHIVDAARSLGAGPIVAFYKVTLPAILPGVAAGFVFAFLTSFDEVVVALFISGIDTVTLPVQMWNGIRFEISPAVAAASSILLIFSVALLIAFTIIQNVGRPTSRDAI
jgi:putative spermidine/putrescine transport system permease protein